MKPIFFLVFMTGFLSVAWKAHAAAISPPANLSVTNISNYYNLGVASPGNMGFRLNLSPGVAMNGSSTATCGMAYLETSDANAAQKIQVILTGFLAKKTMGFYIDNINGSFCHIVEAYISP